MTFAQKMKEILEGRGITYIEFAKQAEVTPHSVAKVLLGAGFPNVPTLIKFAEALDMRVDDLVEDVVWEL